METKIIVLVAILVFCYFIKKRKFRKRLFLLAKNSHLTIKDEQRETYPLFSMRDKWLYIRGFNPLMSELSFDSRLLTAFSNLYGTTFLKAAYEKNAIILKGNRSYSLSFSKCHPKALKPFEAFLGTDEDGKLFLLNTYQRVSFLIGGTMGSGKSILADRLRLSLIRTTGEERSYVFCKNKNDFTHTDLTRFISKDDKAKMLTALREIRDEVIERQKEIESGGYRSASEVGHKPIYVIADEVHTYGRNLTSSYSKEERQEQAEIIEILRFLLYQGRSSLVYIIFITPNLERAELDINLRDCAFIFSSRINSEEVAKNIFGNSSPFLMSQETGLFAFTNKNTTKFLKVAEE